MSEEVRKMTIFYRKSTGTIESVTGVIADMSMFGALRSDYELTHDFIVMDYDDYVMNNLFKFHIVDGQLKVKQDDALSKYM